MRKSNMFYQYSAHQIAKELDQLSKEYQSETGMSFSRPSAPNSSVFRATVGMMVEPCINFMYRAGYYGFDRRIIQGMKIGGGLRLELKNEIKEKIEKILEPFVDNETFYLHKSSGSNYDCIGIYHMDGYAYQPKFVEEIKKVLIEENQAS